MRVVYWRNKQGILFGEVRGLQRVLWLTALFRRPKSPPPLPRHLHADLGLPEPIMHQTAPRSLALWR